MFVSRQVLLSLNHLSVNIMTLYIVSVPVYNLGFFLSEDSSVKTFQSTVSYTGVLKWAALVNVGQS